jgi:hypothetical protein
MISQLDIGCPLLRKKIGACLFTNLPAPARIRRACSATSIDV